MGNNESVTAGNKAQADVSACVWYEYLALTGEGKSPLNNYSTYIPTNQQKCLYFIC